MTTPTRRTGSVAGSGQLRRVDSFPRGYAEEIHGVSPRPQQTLHRLSSQDVNPPGGLTSPAGPRRHPPANDGGPGRLNNDTRKREEEK